MNEKNHVQDGRWTYILYDLKIQEDGRLPMIRKTASEPAEWYEFGLDQNGKAYETYQWCENDRCEESNYTRRISKEALIREIEFMIPFFSRDGLEEETQYCRKMIQALQRLIQAEIIPLSGTLRERVREMLEKAAEPVSQEEMVRFCEFCNEHHFSLHPHAALFYQKYGHLFYHMRPVFEAEEETRNFCFTFCADAPDLAEDLRDDLENIPETVCPLGSFGYGYPASVYITKDGRLFCLHDYEDDVRVFSSLEELLEHELLGHAPQGLKITEE